MRWWRIIFWAVVILVLIIGAASLLLAQQAAAATNVSSTLPNYYAWNDAVGWLDFYDTNSVTLNSSALTGYASSSVGDLSLDCANARGGSVCFKSDYGVCNGLNATHSGGVCTGGDGSGNLTGFAWNDTIGWVSFCGGASSTQCPGTIPYGVTVSPTTGDFSGYAWNDLVGWVSFNCGASCPPNYKVNVSWAATSTQGTLDSSVFDTQQTSGPVLNSIVWEGSAPNGTCVDFQIATSSSSGGPWTFEGPGGAANQYFGAICSAGFKGGVGCAPADTPICVDPSLASGARYLRYRVRLTSDSLQTLTPQVNQVILNWSR